MSPSLTTAIIRYVSLELIGLTGPDLSVRKRRNSAYRQDADQATRLT